MTDDADTDLPELSAADETYVRDLLAGLPAVPVPDDLAARLDAALRTAADERTEGGGDAGVPSDVTAGATGATAGATVVALDDARVRSHSRRARVLQVAAVSVLVVAGVLGVVHVAGSNSVAQTSTGAAGQAAASPKVDSSLMTRSGHAYSDATLVNDVRLLAAHEPLPTSLGATGYGSQESPTDSRGPQTPAESSSPTAAASGSPSTVAGTPDSATPSGDTAVTSHAGLVACLAAVEEGLPDPVTPVAVDQGIYRTQAALVIVLPGSTNPSTTYDVFVVGIACGQNADAHLLLYQLVEAH
jgi:hypothetical protein